MKHLFSEVASTLSDLRQQPFIILCFSTSFCLDAVTEVKTDIYVTSFGPVSDTDMVSLIPGKIKMKNDAIDQRKQIGIFLEQGLVAVF